jgi:hypothetical protein
VLLPSVLVGRGTVHENANSNANANDNASCSFDRLGEYLFYIALPPQL